MAADQRHWGGLTDTASKPLNCRCVEFHRVQAPGSLSAPDHFDEGSFLTIDCMLSSADEFGGGEFRTLEPDGTFATHGFDKGDALVFVSHKPHCISPVTSGLRNVLVVELWEGVERECSHRCERHWGPCGHANVVTNGEYS